MQHGQAAAGSSATVGHASPAVVLQQDVAVHDEVLLADAVEHALNHAAHSGHRVWVGAGPIALQQQACHRREELLPLQSKCLWWQRLQRALCAAAVAAAATSGHGQQL